MTASVITPILISGAILIGLAAMISIASALYKIADEIRNLRISNSYSNNLNNKGEGKQ